LRIRSATGLGCGLPSTSGRNMGSIIAIEMIGASAP
jgi:hypothetical protein